MVAIHAFVYLRSSDSSPAYPALRSQQKFMISAIEYSEPASQGTTFSLVSMTSANRLDSF